MKYLFNITMPVLALFIASMPVRAGVNTVPDVMIEKLPYGKKVSVEINGLRESAAIIIIDERDKALQEVEVEAKSMRAVKIFNLEQLPEGNYRFVVMTGNKETVQPFELSKDEVVIRNDQRQVFLVPSIRIGKNYVDVNWLNSNISDLSVEIQTDNGATVFEDEMKNILKIERRYNLAQLERGNYTVIVNTPFKTYYQRMTLD